MEVAGGSSARLDPVDGRNRFAGGGAREAAGRVVGGHLDARQLRGAAEELAGGRLVERATAQPVWTPAGRRRRAAEHFRSSVEQPLQPQRRAIAPQRISAEAQVLERLENRPQAGVKGHDVVAV